MAEAPSEKCAWLTHEGVTFATSVPANSNRSAIRELIERVYFAESHHPVSRARTILRERIFATGGATPGDRETVKVAAKRLCVLSETAPSSTTQLPPAPPSECTSAEFKPGRLIPREKMPAALERLKGETYRAHEKWTSDRPVSAILLDAAGHVLASAWNTNAAIRTRHAEWNLCEILIAEGRRIPPGAVLYVSLKPCRMCAARIWETAEDPAKLKVVYFENDPGPLAQGTLLDVESSARIRYLGVDHPLFSAVLSDQAGPSLSASSVQ